MDRLKGKVAIITGAAGGICHKASELFCQEGAKVVMVDIDPQVEQFSAEINANGGESIAVVADVAQRDTWVKLKKLADEKYGRIDTVVNGAAAFSPPTHDWAHITSEMIEDVMRVNIDSMLYSYQTVLRYMMKKKIRGSFLNFSSSTALAYNGSAVQGYPFSKACIKLATQNMVNQISKKYGIRFNCLAPNYVWVPKQEKVWDMYREHFEATTPMPYVGMPEDAAWAVVVVALWASIAERVFFICSSETPAGVSELLFYGRKAYPPRIVILPIILRHFLAGAARKSALFP